jgi:hypothetical protein
MSAKSPSVTQPIVGFIDTYIIPVTIESLHLLPDSIVLGTAILAALSMCKSYGVLVFTMVELMLGQRVLANIIGGIAPIGAGSGALNQICQPGFSFPNMMRISIVETIGIPSMFPSPVMFFLSAIVSYMISAMNEFSREIKVLGGDLSARTRVAFALGILLLFAMLMFRYSYGCESFGTLFVSLILGGIAGFALVNQNKALFGRDGVNILNLPILQTADERGKPMYVCSSA